MQRALSIFLVVAALGCGSVADKQACATSTECPVGQYCAHAGGESRCWADATPPTVGAVTATCGTCLRDGVLHVEATVADDAEVLDAAVTLDLAPGSPVQMTRAGSTWTADVQLRRFPFLAFSRSVVATVTARDGARNSSAPVSAAGVGVTRLRWQRPIDSGATVAPTTPAVKSDGTAVIGGSNGKLYFIAADGSDAHAPLTVGTGQITAAPAIGASTIWVGSEDFTLYGVEADGSAVKPNIGVSVGGLIRGSVAVLSAGGKEWALAASSTGFIGATSTVEAEHAVTGPSSEFSVGPAVGLDGRPYAGTAAGSLGAYRLTTSPAVSLTAAWSSPVSVGSEISAAVAVDSTGAIWTAAGVKLTKTVPAETSGAAATFATVATRIVDSPVLLANGDVVFGEQAGVLHRFTSTGTQVWSAEPNLGAAVQSAMVIAGADATLLIPTAVGKLFALRGDGSEAWSATLDQGNSFRAANLHTPPGQSSNIMSTAYVASSGGKLFAVIVDGELDASAPWPKAFHDPRNTNRAGPQP